MSLLEQMTRIGRDEVTPVTPALKAELPLEAPETLAVTQVTAVTPEKAKVNSESLDAGRLLPREQGWLAAIAGYLGCLPQHLLDAKLIDRDDLAEQLDADPAAVARLIRTDPRWIAGGGQ